MIKKLTAKTQELNPKLPQYSNSFSKCLLIKPETQELLLKKGTIYTLFDISGDSNFDTELITKVVTDVLHDFYFQSESISPIQSMEKAIVETKEKVLQLSSDTLTANPQSIVLNILSTVIWGNVIYMVKFGSAKCYLIKEGVATPLEMLSEGNFSTASKVADEDEVLVICSEQFEKTYPSEKLLSVSISENDLASNQACLLMRLLIDTSFSQDEVIDFGLGEAVSKNQARLRAEKITEVLKTLANKIGVFFKFLFKLLKTTGGLLGNLISKIVPKRKATLLTRSITQLSRGEGNKTKVVAFLGTVGVLLALSVFFVFKSTIFKAHKKTAEKPASQQEVKNETVIAPVEDKSKDVEYKIKRVAPEVFYDLKITDSQAEPTEIEAVDTKIVAADRASGKIYVSDISSPSFKQETLTFPGIKSIQSSDGLLSFNDNEGYKTYDLRTSQIKSLDNVDGLSLTFPYAGFVYSISSDILSKNTESGGKLTGTVWGQNPDFNGARSMSIAFSVYVLKQNGELVNYVGGTKTTFAVTGLQKSFSEPTKIVSNIDFDNLYVSDKGNQRIVVLDAKGNLIKQYRNENSETWNDIRSITVTADEKTLFVLNGSKIYKINLGTE